MNTIKTKQLGISTLVVSSALLLLTTMTIMFSANVGIMEAKTASNEYRASQALLAAQAGIDQALASISQYGLENPMPPYTISGNKIITDGEQAISYVDGSTTQITGYYNIDIDKTLPNYPDIITIVSTGMSKDKSATTEITQQFAFASALRGEAGSFLYNSILIVDGNVEVNSNKIKNTEVISGVNHGTDLKIWAKGTVNGSTQTTSAEILPASPSISGNSPALNKLFLSSMRDPSNSGENNDKGVKYMSHRAKCNAACRNPSSLKTTTSNKPLSKMHYLEGSITLDRLTIGSNSYPAIVVVDLTNGDSFSLNNTTINGLLIVKGNWDNLGNQATINGAVIVEGGNLTNGNNLKINYKKDVYDNISKVGTYTRVPGSWSDFN